MRLPGSIATVSTYEDAAAAHGRGDYAKAVSILMPLAENGDARAQVALGVSYAIGEGVARNPAVAVKWYRLAADQGDAFGQSNLGACYGEGVGVAQDWVQSTKWYALAADQGNPLAMSNLGVAYANGQGVEPNFVEAYKWYTLALEKLPTSDVKGREIALGNRARVARLMTPQQIADAEKLARRWKPKR
jgi:TPR repeat protein